MQEVVCIETPERINLWLMRTQLAALKLEISGMRHSSGRSIYAHIKNTYGLRGNKVSAYNQFVDIINWLWQGLDK